MKYVFGGAVFVLGVVGAIGLYALLTMAGAGIKVGKGQSR